MSGTIINIGSSGDDLDFKSLDEELDSIWSLQLKALTVGIFVMIERLTSSHDLFPPCASSKSGVFNPPVPSFLK